MTTEGDRPAAELSASTPTAGYVAAEAAGARHPITPHDRSRRSFRSDPDAITDLRSKVRRDGSTMALAVLGVLLVVAVGFGIFVVSIRVLLPTMSPFLPAADPTLVATVVGFGPTAVSGVVVAVLVRRLVVDRGTDRRNRSPDCRGDTSVPTHDYQFDARRPTS